MGAQTPNCAVAAEVLEDAGKKTHLVRERAITRLQQLLEESCECGGLLAKGYRGGGARWNPPGWTRR